MIAEEDGGSLGIHIGTMIEVPRAALTADEIAGYADFFCFGTNDLTQMTLAFCRDDAENGFLPYYLDARLLPVNPFETLDQTGVGQLVEMAVERARKARPGIKLGVCGEHGGDPNSIAFFHRVGLDYVSCSPNRVPTARLAAAQAVLEKRRLRIDVAFTPGESDAGCRRHRDRRPARHHHHHLRARSTGYQRVLACGELEQARGAGRPAGRRRRAGRRAPVREAGGIRPGQLAAAS